MAGPRKVGASTAPAKRTPTPPPRKPKAKTPPPKKPPGAFRDPGTAPFKPGTAPFKQREQEVRALDRIIASGGLNSTISPKPQGGPQPKQIGSQFGSPDEGHPFTAVTRMSPTKAGPPTPVTPSPQRNMPHLTEQVALAKARRDRLTPGSGGLLPSSELKAEKRAGLVVPTNLKFGTPPPDTTPPPLTPDQLLAQRHAAAAAAQRAESKKPAGQRRPAGAHPEQFMENQPLSHSQLGGQLATAWDAVRPWTPVPFVEHHAVPGWNAVRPYTPAPGIEDAVKRAAPKLGHGIGQLDPVLGLLPTPLQEPVRQGLQLAKKRGLLKSDNATQEFGALGVKASEQIQKAGDVSVSIPAAQASESQRKAFPGQKVITEDEIRQLEQEKGGLGGLPHETRKVLIDRMVQLGWPRQDAIKMVDSDVIHYSGNAPSNPIVQFAKNVGSFGAIQASAPAGILAMGDATVRAAGGDTKPLGKIAGQFIGGTLQTLPGPTGDRPWYENLYWHPGEFIQNLALGVGTADSVASRFARLKPTPRLITPDGFQQPISRGTYDTRPIRRTIQKGRDAWVRSENPATNFIPHFGGQARRRAIAQQDFSDFQARVTHPIINESMQHEVAVLQTAKKIGKHRVAALNSMLQGSDPAERAAFYRNITTQVGRWKGRGATAHARVSDMLTDASHLTEADQAYIDAVRAAATFSTETRAGAGQFSLNLAGRYRVYQEPIQIAARNGDPVAQDLLHARDYWLDQIGKPGAARGPSQTNKTAETALKEVEREIKKHEAQLARAEAQVPEDIGPRPTQANALAARQIQEAEARAADETLTAVQRERWEAKAEKLRAKYPQAHPARTLARKNQILAKPMAGGAPGAGEIPPEVRNMPAGSEYLGKSPVTKGYYVRTAEGEIARSQSGAGPWRFESTDAGWRMIGAKEVGLGDTAEATPRTREARTPDEMDAMREAADAATARATTRKKARADELAEPQSPFTAPTEQPRTLGARLKRPDSQGRTPDELDHTVEYPKLYSTREGADYRAGQLHHAHPEHYVDVVKEGKGWRVTMRRQLIPGDDEAAQDAARAAADAKAAAKPDAIEVATRELETARARQADDPHDENAWGVKMAEEKLARAKDAQPAADSAVKGAAAVLRDNAARVAARRGLARTEGDPNLTVRYAPRRDAEGKEIPNAEGHFDWDNSHIVEDKSGKEVFRGTEQQAVDFKGDTRLTKAQARHDYQEEVRAAEREAIPKRKPGELTPTSETRPGGSSFGGKSESIGLFPTEVAARDAATKWEAEYRPTDPNEIEPYVDVQQRGSGKKKQFEVITRTRIEATDADIAAFDAEVEARFGPFRDETDDPGGDYRAQRRAESEAHAERFPGYGGTAKGPYTVEFDPETRWHAVAKDGSWRGEAHEYKKAAEKEARLKNLTSRPDHDPKTGMPLDFSGNLRTTTPKGPGPRKPARPLAPGEQFAPLPERDPITKKWRANYHGDGTKTAWFSTKKAAMEEAAKESPSQKIAAAKAKAPKHGLGPDDDPTAKVKRLEAAASRARKLGDKAKAEELEAELRGVLNDAPARTRQEQTNVTGMLGGKEPTKGQIKTAIDSRKKSDEAIGTYKTGDDVQMRGSAGVVAGKVTSVADNGDLLVDFGETFGGTSRVPPGDLEFDIAKPPPRKPPEAKKAPAAPGEPPRRRKGVPTREEAIAQHNADLAEWQKAKKKYDAAAKRARTKAGVSETALRRLRRREDVLRLRADQSKWEADFARDPANAGLAGDVYSDALDKFIAQHEAREGTTTPVFIPQEVPQTVTGAYRNRAAGKAMPKERVPNMKATQDRLILSGDYRSTAAGIANESRRAALVQARLDMFEGVKAEYASQPVGGTIADPNVVYVRADALDVPVDLEHTVGMHNITDDQVASSVERARKRLEQGVIDPDTINGFLPDDTSGILQIPKSIYDEIHASVQPYNPGSFARVYDTANRGYQRWMLSKPSTGVSNIAGNPILAMMGGASPWEATYKGYQLAKHPEWMPPQLLEGGLASQLRDGQAFTPIGKWFNYSLSKQRASEQAARSALYHHYAGPHVAKEMAALDMTADEVLRRMASGEDPMGFELARKVTDFLGDMKRSKKFGVGFERGLSRGFLFHRWLGHITTLALYTLPVKYPGRAIFLQRLAEVGDDYRKHHGIYPSWYRGMLPLLQHVIGEEGAKGSAGLFTVAVPTGSIWPTANLPIPLQEEQGANPWAFGLNSVNPVGRAIAETPTGFDFAAMRPYKNEQGKAIGPGLNLDLGASLLQRATPYASYLWPFAGRADTAHVGNWQQRMNKNVHGRPLPPGYQTSSVPYGGSEPDLSWQYLLGLGSRFLLGGSGLQNIPSQTKGTEYQRTHYAQPGARSSYNTIIKDRAKAKARARKKKAAHR